MMVFALVLSFLRTFDSWKYGWHDIIVGNHDHFEGVPVSAVTMTADDC